MSLLRIATVATVLLASNATSAQDFDRLGFYEHLHANPALSFQEQRTAAMLAAL